MNLFSNIWTAAKISFGFKRVAWYIFLIQFFLSLLIGVLAIKYVNSSIGQSTNLMKIIDGYNHDVFQDLLRFESTGWSMIKTFTWLIVLIYLFLGPLIMGGLLNAYHKNKDNWDVFWTGGSKYYFSFLKLNLLVIVFLLIILALLGTIGFFFVNYSLANMLTEIPALVCIFSLLFIFGIFLIYFMSISTNAKWRMINEQDLSVWKNFRSATKIVKSKSLYFLLLGFAFAVLSFFFFFLSNTLINCIPESSFMLVLIAFLLQLLVSFFRVFLRNAYQCAIIK